MDDDQAHDWLLNTIHFHAGPASAFSATMARALQINADQRTAGR